MYDQKKYCGDCGGSCRELIDNPDNTSCGLWHPVGTLIVKGWDEECLE